jgi:1-acyl-sn-glycerol-3-phosphate acyltransferase
MSAPGERPGVGSGEGRPAPPSRFATGGRGAPPERWGVIAPWVRRAALRYARPVVRVCFGGRAEGLERLPRGRPFLLVANHSAVLGVAEIAALLVAWVEHLEGGADAPRLVAFAHPLGIRLAPAAWVLDGVGAVESTAEAAEAVLRAGHGLLVFPGGDHESMRPWAHAGRVDFGGRVGFLRLARRLGVPIVPLGIRGSHHTAPVLWRSTRVWPTLLGLPRWVGLRRYPLTLLGLIGAAALAGAAWTGWGPFGALDAWARQALDGPMGGSAGGSMVGAWARALGAVALGWVWLATPLSFLPWVPARLRACVGPVLEPEDLFSGGGSEAEVLDAALARVERAVADAAGLRAARDVTPGPGR